MNLRAFTSSWLPVWFIAAAAGGWLSSPDSQRTQRMGGASPLASDSPLHQKSKSLDAVLPPEMGWLAPSDQLAVIAAMAEAATDVTGLQQVLDMASKLPSPRISGEARQLVALRWLAFDPVKAVELSFGLDALLNCWAQSDPLAVIEYAKRPDCLSVGDAWLAGMRHLAKKDLQAAWRLYAEAPEGWNEDDDAIEITAAIASLNPAEFAGQLSSNGIGYFAGLGAAKAWLRQDPAVGFAWVARNPAIHDGSDLLVLFEEVPLNAWPEALKVLPELDAQRRERLVEMISSALKHEHPHELIEMMDAAGVEPDVGRGGGHWRAEALGNIAIKDPLAAAALLPRVSPEAYPEAVKRIAGEWARQSPEATRVWVQSLEDGPAKVAELIWLDRREQPLTPGEQRTIEQEVLSNWSYIPFNAPVPDIVLSDPSLLDRLADTVAQIEDCALRVTSGSRVLNAMKSGDSKMILRVLRLFPVGENQFDQNAGHFFWSWNQVNPAAAVSAAESLPEPTRSYALKAIAGK